EPTANGEGGGYWCPLSVRLSAVSRTKNGLTTDTFNFKSPRRAPRTRPPDLGRGDKFAASFHRHLAKLRSVPGRAVRTISFACDPAQSEPSHSCRRAAPGMMKMAMMTAEAMSAAPVSPGWVPARPPGQGPTLLRDVCPALTPPRGAGERGFLRASSHFPVL